MPKLIKNLQQDINILSTRECLNELRAKPFTITPDDLLRITRRELSPTARELFWYLYSRSEKAYNITNKTSPVIVSVETLAIQVFRSTRQIKRCLKELKEKDFITIQNRFNSITREQDSNAIWPIIPARITQELLTTTNRRASSKGLSK
jgi:hypothetical protein